MMIALWFGGGLVVGILGTIAGLYWLGTRATPEATPTRGREWRLLLPEERID